MFMNLAHRGASHYAPENTLAAFYKGLDLGANGLETDLHMSKDGVIFLLHDHLLNRTTNGTGQPSEYSWKELQELDAGSWFSPEFAGERLVSLEWFLHLFGRKSIQLALELKEDGLASDTLAMLKRYDLRAQVTLTSFKYDYLYEVRKQDEQIRLGYLVNNCDASTVEQLKEIRALQICPNAMTITKENVSALKQEGFVVRAWGVKDESVMKHCLLSGVDGMTINFPDKLFEALGNPSM